MAEHIRDDDLPVDPDLPPKVPHPRRWDIALVIAAGGALGGAARYLLNQAVPHSAGGFPWSTFWENVTGCFILAVLMVFLIDVWRPMRYARPFLGIGVMGGFTTFSTYSVDIRGLLVAGEGPLALAYLFGTLAAGLSATWAGLALARTAAGLNRPRHLRAPAGGGP